MKLFTTAALFCSLVVLSPRLAEAQPRGAVKFVDGTIRVLGSAGYRSELGRTWARGHKLMLVLPRRAVSRAGTKIKIKNDAVVREVNAARRGGWSEIEVKLVVPAAKVAANVRIGTEGKDLVIAIPLPLGKGGIAGLPAADEPRMEGKGPKGGKNKTLAALALAKANKQAASKLTKKDKASSGFAGMLGKRSGKPELGGNTPYMLGLALFGIGAVGWWLKRKRKGLGPAAPQIEVVASKSLSGKHRLLLVEAAGERLLLGCTDKEISLLRAPSGGSIIEPQELEAEGPRLLGDEDDEMEEPPTADFVKQLSQRIAQQRVVPYAKGKNKRTPRILSKGTKASKPAPADEALDERWAAGILKLRRARQDSEASAMN